MPAHVGNLRHTARKAASAISFQRSQHTDRAAAPLAPVPSPPPVSCHASSPPQAHQQLRSSRGARKNKSSRSFPDLSRFLDRDHHLSRSQHHDRGETMSSKPSRAASAVAPTPSSSSTAPSGPPPSSSSSTSSTRAFLSRRRRSDLPAASRHARPFQHYSLPRPLDLTTTKRRLSFTRPSTSTSTPPSPSTTRPPSPPSTSTHQYPSPSPVASATSATVATSHTSATTAESHLPTSSTTTASSSAPPTTSTYPSTPTPPHPTTPTPPSSATLRPFPTATTPVPVPVPVHVPTTTTTITTTTSTTPAHTSTPTVAATPTTVPTAVLTAAPATAPARGPPSRTPPAVQTNLEPFLIPYTRSQSTPAPSSPPQHTDSESSPPAPIPIPPSTPLGTDPDSSSTQPIDTSAPSLPVLSLPDRAEMSAPTLHHPPPPPPTPSPAKRILRGLTSSQRIRRLSLGHRTRSRVSNPRSTSFGDTPRIWSSAGPSFLSTRANTDEAVWSRLNPIRSVAERDLRLRRNRLSSYSCSDFEVAEDDIVEIGSRLPDRTGRIAEEDVFGRRRGDFEKSSESMSTLSCKPALAYQDGEDYSNPPPRIEADRSATIEEIPPPPTSRSKPPLADSAIHTDLYLTSNNVELSSPTERSSQSSPPSNALVPVEEEETIRSIAKAIDSSKGRLRKSANMSRAFRAVIRSGDGFVRKSDLIQATLNSTESKDPSMIILLDPEACDSSTQTESNKDGDDMGDGDGRDGGVDGMEGGEGICSTSEESCSGDTLTSMGAGSSAAVAAAATAGATVGFSTSMTAKQCAATLETILREMTCKVNRLGEETEGCRFTIRLRVSRSIREGRKKLERKTRVLVTIREEDRIRTSVSFRRLNGLYSSRESHIPLCKEIRERFQREWPAVVEALYIRLPTVNVSAAADL